MVTVPPLLAQWAPNVSLHPLTPPVRPGWSRFNPSIVRVGESTIVGVRSANYRLTDAGRYEMDDSVIRSETVLVEWSDDREVSSRHLIIDTDRQPSSFPVQGWEDVRLFAHNGLLHGLATVRDVDESGVCRIALLVPDGKDRVREVLVESPDPERHEKNWAPWPGADSIRAVYSWDPLRIITIDPLTGKCSLDDRGATGLGPGTRGGSGAVSLDSGDSLFVVHESHQLPSGRAYLHRFVMLDADGGLVSASPRVRLTGFGVEFVAGADRDGDALRVTFGVGDREAWLAQLPLSAVIDRLRPVSPRSAVPA
jgi:hypothetical protein